MVAMSGAIMPEPLAMPAIVTGWPAISACAQAPLGKVSVVMIAAAASAHASSARRAWSPGSAAVSLSTGICSPITPVEQT